MQESKPCETSLLHRCSSKIFEAAVDTAQTPFFFGAPLSEPATPGLYNTCGRTPAMAMGNEYTVAEVMGVKYAAVWH
jgi:hypothetical protein